ncbi:hypothetical protein QYF36_024647 [Acer negundo]|nr:hypothetical protein QYF36_024647 [Acer negundo]
MEMMETKKGTKLGGRPVWFGDDGTRKGTRSDLSNLKNLKYLSMDYTNLNISILQNIGLLTSLESLSLRDCSLEGILPDQGGLCELKHLQELDLYNNNLRGSLPWCFGNLTSLQVLHLSSNQFSGNISPLRALTSIQELSISSNQFSGNISPLRALTSIQELSISSNQFSGNISPLRALTSIQDLYLSYNHFQIPISLEPFFNHSKLEYFYGYNNQIYADTAESHFSITPKFQLNSLVLSGCRDCVTFPKFLYHQHDLSYVYLSHNNLTGEFPNWLLDNNTNLDELVLVNNSLTGPLHLPTHYHQNLTSLDISNNFFHGNIPKQVGAYLPMLSTLNISINDFDGRIPSSIGDMKELSFLDLSYNKLSGEILEHLAKSCINLRYLVLSNNSLEENNISGDLPSRFSPPKIQQVHLSKNKLEGQLKDAFFNSSSLVTLDLGYNHFNGGIPNWIGRLSNLTYLILSHNNLEGEVPHLVCNLKRLRLIDLSHNNFSGKIPHCLDMTALHGDFSTATEPMRNEEIVRFKKNNTTYYYQKSVAPVRKEENVEFTTK